MLHCRFQGLDGQVVEFELKPNWTLPLQEAPEDWDINPATEDLPLDQVLAQAAVLRREHLAGGPFRTCCCHCEHNMYTFLPYHS